MSDVCAVTLGFYISHPEVTLDPGVPVPDWRLSGVGRGRLKQVCSAPWLQSLGRIMSSPEAKARETASILSKCSGAPVVVVEGSGEVDRSSTGYVPHQEHEDLADRLFGEPTQSACGWETAVAAQKRIVAVVNGFLQRYGSDCNVAIVGHGAVGSFLLCALANRPIARSEDQKRGGSVFVFDLRTRDLLLEWTKIEDVQACLESQGLSV